MPQKAGLDPFDHPIARPPGDDGLKFGGADNEPAGQDDDIDQLAFVTIFMPPGVKTVKTTFDVLLVSQQDPADEGRYDHLFWGLQTTLDQSNLNERYDCNEDVAVETPHTVCWNETWLLPTAIEVDMESGWPSLPGEGGNVYVGFWVDVSHYDPSTFYIDNLKMECRRMWSKAYGRRHQRADICAR